MRIAVITDAHANLPATQAALTAIGDSGVDCVIHLGDAVGIGPQPREVLELLLSQANIVLIQGNHDRYFANGLPTPVPQGMTPGEAVHQQWVRAQIPARFAKIIRQWPLTHTRSILGTSFRFQHYAIRNGDFASVSLTNDPVELDAAFQPATDVVFFGHHHIPCDTRGKARYLNPGALGCNGGPYARYALIDTTNLLEPLVSMHAVEYDLDSVRKEMILRDVPEAGFILRTFLS